ncbi:hypothetical protein OU789_13295 [Halocynthiibacter sp. C4]|uniref:hypothetical protein n=1 Tax=Halocynthiibacter sp. C4 TaxID=2992758 RepID=UPI00237BE4E7|nr:hypothetical protein [Halocynthiibacter sp. C4]MDE0590906.1 hypothetical protein [Halocynthiibacter sp. C4]
MRRAIFATVLLAVFGPFAKGAIAQSTFFDAEVISAACAVSSENCAALIQQLISQLKSADLTEAELNSQVAVLASAVLNATSGASPSNIAQLSPVLTEISGLSSDAGQASSILGFAREMESGRAPELSNISTPFAASPA